MHRLIKDFVPFNIGPVKIDRPLIQAPLDGISDSPFRRITRELGSPLSITEFVNALDVVHTTPNLAERIAFDESERPIVFQLFDEDPQRIIESARILEERCHPDIFDVNMGCSARRVANRGAGAGLLRDTAKIRQIVDGLVKSVHIPVTVKIRLGWDDASRNFLEVGKIAQDCGAAMVTLHARTREQQYSGKAEMPAIAALKAALDIPVVGNGDVQCMADAQRMFDETGCDAVMVGRGAVIDPWIFAGYDLDEVPEALFRETCLKHLKYTIEHNGENWGIIVFRKFAKRYLDHVGADPVAVHELITSTDPVFFSRRFEELLSGTTILS